MLIGTAPLNELLLVLGGDQFMQQLRPREDSPRGFVKSRKKSRAPQNFLFGARKVSCGALLTTAQDWAKRTV